MAYSEIEKRVLDEESYAPIKDSDIAPYIHKSGVRVNDPKAAAQMSSSYDPEDDEDDGYYDEDDENDFDTSNDWNLRKCAAASLDMFSCIYGNVMLNILLPQVQERMKPHISWEIKEAAILAVGAVAEGCRTGMESQAHSFIPFLAQMLKDPKPLVRSITCWALSRYAKWISEQPNPDAFLVPSLVGILTCVNDDNKRVQEAACSAFSTFVEIATAAKVSPYLKPILQYLSSAFKKYHRKNLVILYDSISTLSDVVQQNLNQPELVSILMPPLIEKWNKLTNSDADLLPLLECLCSVATALKSGFLAFAKPVWMRCIAIIENTYKEEEAIFAANQQDDETVDKDFVVCSLDLLAAIVDALGPTVESLVKESKLLPVLVRCSQDLEAHDVKQSAFGLVGDLAKTCIGHLRDVLQPLVPVLIMNIDAAHVGSCNNSIWAIGEISMQVKKDIASYVPEILKRVVPIMQNQSLNAGLLENTAITIGRLGLVCPENIAPAINMFCKTWCVCLRSIRNEIEKDHAYRGLCQMIRVNPNGVVTDFAFVVDAMVNFPTAKPELKMEFITLLRGFKQGMGEMQWNNYVLQFPAPTQQTLKQEFKL